LAKGDSKGAPRYQGVAAALRTAGVEIRLFGKPTAHKHRRMGVALARGRSAFEARRRAIDAARGVQIGS